MTVVSLRGLHTALGEPVVTSGVVMVEYWAGSRPVARVDGADVIFPALITAPVVAGDPGVLDLPPTRGVCCVKWTVQSESSATSVVRFTEIPETAADFGDLVQVDPATFVPTGEVVAAWEAVVGTVEGLRDAAATSADEASASAQAAHDSAAPVLAAAATISAGIDATDGAFAAVLDDPDSESTTRLTAKIAKGSVRGATIAALGDSFTAQNGPPGGYGPTAGAQWYPANGWLDWAISFLHKRVVRRGIFGVGGQTTAQILARVGDVIALDPRPTYCIVQGGTNDTNLNVPAATTIANQQATCEALIQAGIIPVLVSIPPVPYRSAGQLASVSAVLSWQKTYARETPGLIYCDWRRYTAKPDGTWRTGFSDDTIHPNSVGCSRMGWALAETLKGIIPKVDTLTTQNNDPKLVNENPLMVGTGGTLGAGVTGSAPDNWNIEAWVGDTTVTAVSSVEEDALTGERSWKVVMTGGSVQMRRQRNVGSGWNVGDQVYAECEFEVDGSQTFANIDKLNLQIDVVSGATGTSQDPNAPSSDAANHPAASFMAGVLRTPVLTVPAGASIMSAKFIVRRVATTTPEVTFRVRRFAWRKL